MRTLCQNLLITFSHKTQGLFQDDNGLPKSSPDIWDILFGIFIRKESSRMGKGGLCSGSHTVWRGSVPSVTYFLRFFRLTLRDSGSPSNSSSVSS